MKKIFTLLAGVLLAIGAQAQTTYDFSGLTAEDFSVTNGEMTTYTMDGVEGPAVSYPTADEIMTVTFVGKNNFSLEYKNSSSKNNVIKTSPDFLQLDSKNFYLKFSNVSEGQVITIYCSAKGSTNSKFGTLEGCVADPDNPESIGKQESVADYIPVKFTATATEVSIRETAGGVRISKITIEEGSGTITPQDPTAPTHWDFSVTSDADKAALAADATHWTYSEGNNRYSNAEDLAKDTDYELTANGSALEGFAGLVIGRDGGSIAAGNLRIDVDKRFQINASNGYIKLLNMAKDDIIYIHFASASTSEEDRTLTISNGVADDPSTLVSSLNTDEKIAKVTVSANGDVKISQSKGVNFYQIFVNTDDMPTGIVPATHQSTLSQGEGACYDLSGRRVDANYHGVVIMNGKKIIK